MHHTLPRQLRRLLALALLGAALPVAAGAQGNLSTQGLGYPQGGVSTRALSTGGALTETDPTSTVNPAALASFGTTTLYFQYEPEFRRVTAGNRSDYTVTTRFPLMTAAIPVGQQWVVALSASDFLDRTWSTMRSETLFVRTDTVTALSHLSSNGSISDVRLAVGYVARPWLRFGLEGHVFPGSERLVDERTFSDSTVYQPVRDSSTLSYSGSAIGAGVEIIAPGALALGISARKGGELRASKQDSTLAHANIPDRFGVSLAYIGIANTTIAARTALDKWSALGGLVSGSEQPKDSWDTSVGADVAGPRWGAFPLQIRGGLRWRTLPFPVTGGSVVAGEVKERSESFGFGAILARGRASAEIGAIHATRTAPVGASEKAWTISMGLTVRP
jgi:hypothetical protein